MSTHPTPVVLVHGGGFTGSCWDFLLEHMDGPVLAVDLPGRGRRPAALSSVTLESAAASVVADIDAAGFDEVVLAGHSLAGCSMPGAIGMLAGRVRHAVFIACTVPEDGTTCMDTLPADIRALAHRPSENSELGVLPDEMARAMFAGDLDEDQVQWMLGRMVPEAPALTFEKVDLSALRSAMPRTWVRTLRDAVVPPERQTRFVGNVGDCDVIDIDAAHMCMISQPNALGGILNRIAAG